MKQIPLLFVAAVLSATSMARTPDDGVVDKIYHPYVLPFEREVEWRFMSRQTDSENALVQRFAFGQAVSETVSVEAYLVASRDERDDFGVEAYEIETRWMITEQGRYWADWGLQFDLEKEHLEDNWEFSSGLVMEKELGRSSFTANLFMVYEWGKDAEEGYHTEIRAQYRYRWQPWLQPAIEVYTAPDFVGVGPTVMGIKRFDRQKQLKWELGFISGLNGNNKDHTLRFVLEYEF